MLSNHLPQLLFHERQKGLKGSNGHCLTDEDSLRFQWRHTSPSINNKSLVAGIRIQVLVKLMQIWQFRQFVALDEEDTFNLCRPVLFCFEHLLALIALKSVGGKSPANNPSVHYAGLPLARLMHL